MIAQLVAGIGAAGALLAGPAATAMVPAAAGSVPGSALSSAPAVVSAAAPAVASAAVPAVVSAAAPAAAPVGAVAGANVAAVPPRHPLGNFSVNRYAGLTVAPGEVRVDHVQDIAEIPAAQLTSRIDRDGDGRTSAAELTGWAAERCRRAAAELEIDVAGRTRTLTVRSSAAVARPGQAALPTLRLECGMVTAGAGVPLAAGQSAQAGQGGQAGHVDIAFRDTGATGGVGWHEITARGDRMTLLSSNVRSVSRSARLSSYPADLLTSPPDERAARLRARPGGPAAGGAAGGAARPGTGVDGVDGGVGGVGAGTDGGTAQGLSGVLPRGVDGLTRRFTALVERHAATPGFAVVALLIAIGLGALHALAPGHGKTIMAAYAAGRGRRRDIATLGITVTVTHTAGVLVLGVLVATGSAIVPARAFPWLGVASGALVAVVGVTLLRRALRGGSTGHSHSHGHGHSHTHHSHHAHAGADGSADESAGRPRTRGVVLMGFAGGLLPSPSAVVVLVGANALGRPWFGVGLVLAYGVGLALTLGLIGLLVVGPGLDLARRAGAWATRYADRWTARRLASKAAAAGFGAGAGAGPGGEAAAVTRTPAGGLARLLRDPRSAMSTGTAALVVLLGLGLVLRSLPAAFV